jgi:hypothetical protein
MKLCHAVVLFAAGWYLMIPPFQDGVVKTDAPLSQWSAQASYYTADECQRDQQDQITVAILDQPKSEAEGLTLRISKGSCIATDDPRLSEPKTSQ